MKDSQKLHSIFRYKGPLRVIAFITLWSFLFTAIPPDIILKRALLRQGYGGQAWAANKPSPEVPRVASGEGRSPSLSSVPHPKTSNLAIDALFDDYDVDPETRAQHRWRLAVKLVEARKSNQDLLIKVVDPNGHLTGAAYFAQGKEGYEAISPGELTGLDTTNAIVETFVLPDINSNLAAKRTRSPFVPIPSGDDPLLEAIQPGAGALTDTAGRFGQQQFRRHFFAEANAGGAAGRPKAKRPRRKNKNPTSPDEWTKATAIAYINKHYKEVGSSSITAWINSDYSAVASAVTTRRVSEFNGSWPEAIKAARREPARKGNKKSTSPDEWTKATAIAYINKHYKEVGSSSITAWINSDYSAVASAVKNRKIPEFNGSWPEAIKATEREPARTRGRQKSTSSKKRTKKVAAKFERHRSVLTPEEFELIKQGLLSDYGPSIEENARKRGMSVMDMLVDVVYRIWMLKKEGEDPYHAWIEIKDLHKVITAYFTESITMETLRRELSTNEFDDLLRKKGLGCAWVGGGNERNTLTVLRLEEETSTKLIKVKDAEAGHDIESGTKMVKPKEETTAESQAAEGEAEEGRSELPQLAKQELIGELWRKLSRVNRAECRRIARQIQSTFETKHENDFQAIFIDGQDELIKLEHEALERYRQFLSKEEYQKCLRVVEHALDNLYQHGGYFGALLLRFRIINNNQLQFSFILLDRGEGFARSHRRHAPLHEAVKYGKSLGIVKGTGKGLYELTELANYLSITAVDQMSDEPRAYYWEKGFSSEQVLDEIPVENGVKIVFDMVVPLKGGGKKRTEPPRGPGGRRPTRVAAAVLMDGVGPDAVSPIERKLDMWAMKGGPGRRQQRFWVDGFGELQGGRGKASDKGTEGEAGKGRSEDPAGQGVGEEGGVPLDTEQKRALRKLRRARLESKLRESPPEGKRWTVPQLAEKLGEKPETVYNDLKSLELLDSERLYVREKEKPSAEELTSRRARLESKFQESPPEGERWIISQLAEELSENWQTVYSDLKSLELLDLERLDVLEKPSAEELTSRRARLESKLRESPPEGKRWTVPQLAEKLGEKPKTVYNDLESLELLDSERLSVLRRSDPVVETWRNIVTWEKGMEGEVMEPPDVAAAQLEMYKSVLAPEELEFMKQDLLSDDDERSIGESARRMGMRVKELLVARERIIKKIQDAESGFPLERETTAQYAEEWRVSDRGTISWLDKPYSVGRHRAGQTLSVEPFDGVDKKSGFKAYDSIGLVAWYNFKTGAKWVKAQYEVKRTVTKVGTISWNSIPYLVGRHRAGKILRVRPYDGKTTESGFMAYDGTKLVSWYDFKRKKRWIRVEYGEVQKKVSKNGTITYKGTPYLVGKHRAGETLMIMPYDDWETEGSGLMAYDGEGLVAWHSFETEEKWVKARYEVKRTVDKNGIIIWNYNRCSVGMHRVGKILTVNPYDGETKESGFWAYDGQRLVAWYNFKTGKKWIKPKAETTAESAAPAGEATQPEPQQGVRRTEEDPPPTGKNMGTGGMPPKFYKTPRHRKWPGTGKPDKRKVRLGAAKEVAQKKRIEAVGSANASYNMRDAAVISVIGHRELDKSVFAAEADKIERSLWKRGLGRRGIQPFKGFTIHTDRGTRENIESTWEGCKRAINNALEKLDNLGEEGRIVLYAPEIRGLKIHLAERAKTEYGDRVIVAADAYPDLRSPDIRARDMLSRLMASCDITDEGRHKIIAFRNIQNFLRQAFGLDISAIADADGKTIDTLAALLKHLLGMPLGLDNIWNNMKQMRKSYEALDIAV